MAKNQKPIETVEENSNKVSGSVKEITVKFVWWTRYDDKVIVGWKTYNIWDEITMNEKDLIFFEKNGLKFEK